MKRILTTTAILFVIFGIAGQARAQAPSSSYDTTTLTETKKPIAGYEKGFFIQSEDGKYKFILNPRLETMFYWQNKNAPDDPTTPTLDESADHLAFRLRRANMGFKAVYDNRLSLKLDITASSSDNGVSATYFAFGTYDFNDYVGITFGMVDPDYDLQGLFSTKVYSMVDFPIIVTQADGERPVWRDVAGATTIARPSFGLPTQLGFVLNGNYFDQRFNWALGFGNGTESFDTINRNYHFTYVLRLSYNILGESPYGSMSDYAYSTVPSLAVGLAGAYESDPALKPTPPLVGQAMYNWSLDGTADVAFRYKGFAIDAGGYYRQMKVGPAAIFEAGENYLTDIGYMASVAAFILPKKLEAQAWATQIIREGPDNDVYEFGGGFNYYFAGPNVRFQIDYSRVVDYDDIIGTNHGHTDRIRAKMQTYF